jgi:hypothetical protein
MTSPTVTTFSESKKRTVDSLSVDLNAQDDESDLQQPTSKKQK